MARPALSAAAELLKPITWFPPLWAFGCGVVAPGVPFAGRWRLCRARAWTLSSPAFARPLIARAPRVRRFLDDPLARAVGCSGLGLTRRIGGMRGSAFALRGIAGAAA